MTEAEKTLIQKVRDLPSLSPVIQRVNAIMTNPESSADDIVNVLKLDPGITSKVLRLANSAYIGIPRTVSSLQNAVVILGQRRVHSLVLAVSALSSLHVPSQLPFDSFQFWKHSVVVASIAESIAKHLKRYDTIETGDVFSAGILHDIGKLVIGMYSAESIQTAYKRSVDTKTPLFRNESNKINHYGIGALLAAQWNFPEMLVNSIQFHHTPSLGHSYEKSVMIIHISDIMAHLIGFDTVTGEGVPVMDDTALKTVGLSPERLKVIADNTMNNQKELESLIEFLS